MIIERTTDITATAAIISPLWLKHLEAVSEVAALILPILGGVWLLVQIWAKVKTTIKDHRN